MKTKFAILGLAVVCLCGQEVKADTITTGDLSFGCYTANGCLLPTSGSFSYDNTTNQFLSITFNWDGLHFDTFESDVLIDGVFVPDIAGQKTVYLELLGLAPLPLRWEAICSGGLSPPPGVCSGLFGFDFHDLAGVFMGLGPEESNTLPEFLNVGGAGVVIATDLVTTTPEPASLVLLGIGLLGLGWLTVKESSHAANSGGARARTKFPDIINSPSSATLPFPRRRIVVSTLEGKR